VSDAELPQPVSTLSERLLRGLYTLLLALLLPALLLRLLWRSRAEPGYRQRIAERFGRCTLKVDQPCIWIHAVSFGETMAARPLVEALLERFPQGRLLITSTTATGSARVRTLFGDRVEHCYLPYDLPIFLDPFLRRARPALAIFMETELWPNLLARLQQLQVPAILANGRLSQRSAQGYARIGGVSRAMMQRMTLVAAQHRQDGERFVELGLPAERMVVTGNLKFDHAVDPRLVSEAERLRVHWSLGGRPVWVAGSTHEGEEPLLLSVHRQLLEKLPDTLLILVPRHPQRFDAVARLVDEMGFKQCRRSSGARVTAATQLLLGDTMGELQLWYALADLAFVGGSLVPVGGHNLLEPAALGRPVLSGPHLFNFNETRALLLQAGAARVVEDQQALLEQLLLLLADRVRRTQMGGAGCAVVEGNRGATLRLLALLEHYLPQV